ncbi:Acid phosphatase [Parasponia andersonii]|uniref:Acid phosphatase n=1 Tax=Parasponia andersonii TaxID=3476 RepID=A0A2P5ANQ5_PARAD|nr:Acid phosphatase [Parasponia andersonii]
MTNCTKPHVTPFYSLDPNTNLEPYKSLYQHPSSMTLLRNKMAISQILLLCSLSLCIGLAFADCNILNQRTKNGLKISLKNYCESWRMNVEIHNIRQFEVVPEECNDYIVKYVTSTQYKVDSERALDESLVYLSTSCSLKKDGKDAWIFDVDDTLLSNVPYYKNYHNGGEKLNLTSLEEWQSQGKAPALDYSLKLFNEIKSRGLQIFLVSFRRECLRSDTIDNLMKVGFYGWKSLILRGAEDEQVSVQDYKAGARKKLISQGYRIWGIVGDQYSSIEGLPSAKRTFKLPNPMYYVS